MQVIKFKKWNCVIEVGEYNNGRKALTLFSEKTGEHIATITVNLPNESIDTDCAFIKNYSENQGIEKALIKAGVIDKTPIKSVRSGYENIPLYKVLI